jgi:hypothetical protein
MHVLHHLNPISFAIKEDASHQHHLAFVAEEVPAMVATPDHKGFSPMAIIAVLTKVVKQQQQLITGLQEAMGPLKDLANSASVEASADVQRYAGRSPEGAGGARTTGTSA